MSFRLECPCGREIPREVAIRSAKAKRLLACSGCGRKLRVVRRGHVCTSRPRRCIPLIGVDVVSDPEKEPSA